MLEPHRYTKDHPMRYTPAELAVYEKIRTKVVGSRIAIASVLGVVLIILKLAGVLALSWWWTTSPLWGGALLFLATIVHITALKTANTQKQR